MNVFYGLQSSYTFSIIPAIIYFIERVHNKNIGDDYISSNINFYNFIKRKNHILKKFWQLEI
jgi:hypothetical protein